MFYYNANVRIVSGEYYYQVPNVRKITECKYKWILENKNIPNTIQAECCFVYPDMVISTSDLHAITQQEYDDYAKIILQTDKTQILSDGIDEATITAEFTEAGGIAYFIILKSNAEKEIIQIPIPENKIAILPKENITSTKKGIIEVRIRSNKWHSTIGLGGISINVV